MAKARSRKGKLNKNLRNEMAGSFDRYIECDDDIEAFKPQESVNKVRIVPGMGDDADSFGHKVFFHYGVGPDGGTYVCPLKSGDYDWCPVCAERNRLQNDASDEYLYQLRPKPRMLTYLIDRKADDDEIKFWSMPIGSNNRPGVALEIVDYAEDEDTGELLPFDDYYEGHDLSFRVVNAGKMTAAYSKYKFDPNPSPMVEDEELLEELLDWLDKNPLDSIVKVYEPEYIEKLFNAGGSEESESEEEDETPRRRKKTKKKAAKKEVEEESETEEEDDEPPFDPDEEGEEETESEEEEAEDQKAQSRARLSKYKKKAKKKKKTGRK